MMFVQFATPHSFLVEHHRHEYRSNTDPRFVKVMQVPSTNKTHYIITILCVESRYFDLNV